MTLILSKNGRGLKPIYLTSKIRKLKSYFALPLLFLATVWVGIIISTVIYFLFHVYKLDFIYQVYMVGAIFLFGIMVFSITFTLWLIIHVVGEIIVA